MVTLWTQPVVFFILILYTKLDNGGIHSVSQGVEQPRRIVSIIASGRGCFISFFPLLVASYTMKLLVLASNSPLHDKCSYFSQLSHNTIVPSSFIINKILTTDPIKHSIKALIVL